MKKFFAVFIALLLCIGIGVNANAKEMTFFGCKTKGYTKTCSYGYPQSDVGKSVIYKYNKNNILRQKEIIYRAPLVTERIVYKYNSKGQLKTNKFGKATRYTQLYHSDKKGKNPTKLLIKYTEFKRYNAKGSTYSKYKKYYPTKQVKTKNDIYYTSYLSQTKYYKYNSKGQLKSNKYGKASRVVKKFKQKNKKSYNYYIQKGKYNKKGKLFITSSRYR